MFKPAVPIALLMSLSPTASSSVSVAETSQHHFVVLDGDTVVVDGSPIRIAGIDAPELGPWAKCWAEAALAGHAREYLGTLIWGSDRGGWSLRDISTADGRGRRTARLVDREGYDIAEDMIVGGYAAQTSGSWDWCGGNANLHQVLETEPPPHGPSLWWPTAHMFDARAAD
jgi:micrococcal nuclease